MKEKKIFTKKELEELMKNLKNEQQEVERNFKTIEEKKEDKEREDEIELG